MKPSLLVINETQLLGKMEVSLNPYINWSQNRTQKGGDGIATAVSQIFWDTAVGAGEGIEDDEYLITRIEVLEPALNVVNCYGEQRKYKKEEVEEKWGRLRRELEDIRRRGEFCVCTGDLNKLVGNIIPGNSPNVSLGGKLLRKLLDTGNWILVNGLGGEIVKGGPYTRQDPATGNQSCLDLFIVSKNMLPFIDTLVIDSDRKMTPASKA